MEATITIHLSGDDPDNQLELFVAALETLLVWQWDNVAVTSSKIGHEEE